MITATRPVTHPDFAEDRQRILNLVDSMTEDERTDYVHINADGTLGGFYRRENHGGRIADYETADHEELSYRASQGLDRMIAAMVTTFVETYSVDVDQYTDGYDFWLTADGR